MKVRRKGIDYFPYREAFYLDEEQCKTIRKKMIDQSLTVGRLADRYGVSQAFISAILRGCRTSKEIYQKLEKDFNIKIFAAGQG